ncbi:MAG: hypothetical protein AMXMBFR13_26430 [Phycisphaerae bacterium]
MQTITIPLVAMTVFASHAGVPTAPVEPLLLFMQPADTRDAVGMLTFEANALMMRGPLAPESEKPSTSQPVERSLRRNRDSRIDFRALLSVPEPDGSRLVYGNSTDELDTEPRTFRWTLYRARTRDGYHYSDLQEIGRNPEGPWLIEAAMVRQDSTGRIFFFPWSRSERPAEGHALWGFVSSDGRAWRPLADEPLYLDHDAFGMMWDARTHRFLTGQVTYQPWKKPYPDNMGPERRRVLTMRTSEDGAHWKQVGHGTGGGLITPDDQDPPDVEFYRLQPFAYGDRYVAMADLYAASPLTSGKHGPHLACEWWVSADGINWERPWRSLDARGDTGYPVKMAPMFFGREMLFWLAGQVCAMPEYRIASVGARSNAEFSTVVFTMPERPLLINASVPGGTGLFNQAYVQVELRDEIGTVIPGYERDRCLLQNVDDTRIPLRWGERTGSELTGRKVSLRFRLRSARIYVLAVQQ